jgi:uncharacterized protein
MTRDRLFLDTAFIQALLNPRDNYHSSAKQLFPRIRAATEVWITENCPKYCYMEQSFIHRHGSVVYIFQCVMRTEPWLKTFPHPLH